MSGLIALVMGGLAFYLVVGPNALDPSNLEWIYGIDPTQHYLGWAIYRYGPWTFPIGLNPYFGLEISSSIVFSDSIPLMAILLKPFSAWLSDPFQYLGIWVLACLVLQAYFAWLLMGLMSSRLPIKLLGTGLLVFSPPMLWRIGLHAALVSHFLILAALYLALSVRTMRHTWWWIILLLATAMIHVYLLLMILCIWFGDFLDQVLIVKSLSIKRALSQLGIAFGLMLICVWQVGYFVLGFGSAATLDLYGGWGLNLASFVDPQGWTYINHFWPKVTGNSESFFYLGLGLIFLFPFAAVALPATGSLLLAQIKHHCFLVSCLLVLMLFAITNQVSIGTFSFAYALPSYWIEHYASIFRLSARLAWPIWYVLALTLIFLIVKRCSYTQACAILGIAFVIQVIDTSSGYLPMRERNQTARNLQYGQPSQSPFWEAAAKRYKQVKFFPLHDNPLPQSHWHTLASYAAKYHLATNDVYLSRLDQSKVQFANQQFRNQLRNRALDSSTLYVFEDANVPNIRPFIDRQKDYLAKIDGGLSVLAPNWKTCPECPLDASEQAIDVLLVKPSLGERIRFTSDDRGGQIVGWGWAKPESWGVWAKDPIAVISLVLPSHSRSILFEFNALVSPQHPVQRVKVRVNDEIEQLFTLTKAQDNRVKVILPAHLRGPYVQIEFEFLDLIRPIDFGMGQDTRKLSAGLLAITFE